MKILKKVRLILLKGTFLKKLVFFIILYNVFCGVSIKAGTVIRGTVTTTKGEPVSGALVKFISSSDTSKHFSILTDSYGKFVIEITDSSNESSVNHDYFLYQNYPNPFSERTTIEYYVKNPSPVTINIYDILGQKVKTYNNYQVLKGFNWIQWDGTDDNNMKVTPGIYLYSIAGGQGIQTKKMIYLRKSSSRNIPQTAKYKNDLSPLQKVSQPKIYNIQLENTDYTNPKIEPIRYEYTDIEINRLMNFKVNKIIREYLGFENKVINRLIYSEPYLYVSAATEGLWRRDVINKTPWEYLGLGDTSLGPYSNKGVVDLDVREDDILVAYDGSAPHINPDSTVGIWHSTDGGRNWFRSDDGIPETMEYPLEYNIINSLQRSFIEPNIVIASLGPAIYRSTNNGYNWQLILGRRAGANEDHMRFNPYRKGEIWRFGSTSVLEAYLICLNENGSNFKVSVDLIRGLGFYNDVGIYDIAFESGDSNIVYVSTTSLRGGVMKTTDGGYTWELDAIKIPGNMAVTRILENPLKAWTLYMINGNYVYYTNDGGKRVNKIEAFINKEYLNNAAFDAKNEILFISSEKGIYSISVEKVSDIF